MANSKPVKYAVVLIKRGSGEAYMRDLPPHINNALVNQGFKNPAVQWIDPERFKKAYQGSVSAANMAEFTNLKKSWNDGQLGKSLQVRDHPLDTTDTEVVASQAISLFASSCLDEKELRTHDILNNICDTVAFSGMVHPGSVLGARAYTNNLPGILVFEILGSANILALIRATFEVGGQTIRTVADHQAVARALPQHGQLFMAGVTNVEIDTTDVEVALIHLLSTAKLQVDEITAIILEESSRLATATGT